MSASGYLLALGKFQRKPYSLGGKLDLIHFARAFRHYHVGGRQLDAVAKMVAELTAKHIHVVLVRMPASKDQVDLFPNKSVDRDRFTQALESFAASHPVTYIDAEAKISSATDLYVDPLHLNIEGRRLTTEFVCSQIANLV